MQENNLMHWQMYRKQRSKNYLREKKTAECRGNRLQNSPYFCVFKYVQAVKQKVWNEAENRERDLGRDIFFLFPHTPARALRA